MEIKRDAEVYTSAFCVQFCEVTFTINLFKKSLKKLLTSACKASIILYCRHRKANASRRRSVQAPSLLWHWMRS